MNVNNKLLNAAIAGDVDDVKAALDAGAVVSHNDYNASYKAYDNGHNCIIRYLMSDVRTSKPHDISKYLFQAALTNNKVLAQELLTGGAQLTVDAVIECCWEAKWIKLITPYLTPQLAINALWMGLNYDVIRSVLWGIMALPIVSEQVIDSWLDMMTNILQPGRVDMRVYNKVIHFLLEDPRMIPHKNNNALVKKTFPRSQALLEDPRVMFSLDVFDLDVCPALRTCVTACRRRWYRNTWAEKDELHTELIANVLARQHRYESSGDLPAIAARIAATS